MVTPGPKGLLDFVDHVVGPIDGVRQVRSSPCLGIHTRRYLRDVLPSSAGNRATSPGDRFRAVGSEQRVQIRRTVCSFVAYVPVPSSSDAPPRSDMVGPLTVLRLERKRRLPAASLPR